MSKQLSAFISSQLNEWNISKGKIQHNASRNCSRENHCTWWRFCTNVPSIWSNDKLRTSAARYFPMESSPVESWKNYICSVRVIPNSDSFFWVCTTSGTYKFSHLWWASPMSDNKFGSMPSWPVIPVYNNVLGQHRPVCSTCRCLSTADRFGTLDWWLQQHPPTLWVADMYMLLSTINFQSFLSNVSLISSDCKMHMPNSNMTIIRTRISDWNVVQVRIQQWIWKIHVETKCSKHAKEIEGSTCSKYIV